MKIEQQIKTNRKRIGLSQEKMSQLMGYTSNVVGRWENGNLVPTLNNLNKMYELFGFEFNIKIP